MNRLQPTFSMATLRHGMPLTFLLTFLSVMPTARGGVPPDTVSPPQMVIDSLESLSPARIEREFILPPFGVEHQARLELEARIDWKQLAGSNPWIRVAINGNFLGKTDLLNKRDEFRLRNGVDITWSQGDRWRVLYSPDFEQAIKDVTNLNACPDCEPYRYLWNITPFVRPGRNTLRVDNLQVLAKPTKLVLRNVRVEVGRPILPPPDEVVNPAPTGPLPEYVARGASRVPMKVTLAAGGGLRLAVADRDLCLDTRTSLPDGNWHATPRGDRGRLIVTGQSAETGWQTANCQIRRRVTVHSDHVDVADMLTNTTGELIGIMLEHRLSTAGKPREVRLGGRPTVGETGSAHNACHPSAFARWGDLGVGLVAVDDVFRVHVRSFAEKAAIGLSDPELGLEPRKSITLEWSIYPMPGSDYWDFVNAVRRVWDANFTIPGPFCFATHFQDNRPAAWYGDWVTRRGLKIVAGDIAQYPDGRYAHGTGILYAPQWVVRQSDWTRKMRQAAPGIEVLSYFHAQCCCEPGSEEKYADSRLIDRNGEHLSYPYSYRLPLYLPTQHNSYGRALWGYVQACLDKVGSTGLYWDEMSYSMTEYAYQAPWDGVTVVIDPRTHRVTGKRSSVTLLMQPFQLDAVHFLREHKKFLLANTQATTRTMLNEKVLRFVETQSYSAMVGTHLGCPLGLGNHHLEKTQADSARCAREILRQGGVYYGWLYLRQPASWNFTSVMYPLTPVELREGVVLAKERILTVRSGLFGWPDGAAAEVYVIDEAGRRVETPTVKSLERAGRRLYEIRMPSNHFAVLVRK
jgi:hypothetical protein